MRENLFEDPENIERGNELMHLMNLGFILKVPNPVTLPASPDTVTKRIVAGEHLTSDNIEILSERKLATIGKTILTSYFERDTAYMTDLETRTHYAEQIRDHQNDAIKFLHEYVGKPAAVRVVPEFIEQHPIEKTTRGFIATYPKRISGYLSEGLGWNSSPTLWFYLSQKPSLKSRHKYQIQPYMAKLPAIQIAIGE